MMKVEIAGLAINYRNAVELNAKIRRELSETRGDRQLLEQECKDMRKKEKALERFLGERPESSAKDQTGGSHAN